MELVFSKDHLFLKLNGENWLLDTGSPVSFGHGGQVSIGSKVIPIPAEFMGVNAAKVAADSGTPCRGLLGGDVLGQFDWLWDVPARTAEVSEGILSLEGASVPFQIVMGVPMVEIGIGKARVPVFFDTGAQVSYLEDELLAAFPDAGSFDDFHHTIGRYTTATRRVDLTVGDIPFSLRCGNMPMMIKMAVSLGGSRGVLGNAILAHRACLYAPRQNVMVLAR